MLEFDDAIVRNLIFHRISNDNDGYLNSETFVFDEEQDAILKKIFLKPFASNTNTYEFKHDIDLDLNPLFKLSKSIYEDGNFRDISKDIYQHLKTVSKHPNIKAGDLFLVQYSDVRMNNTFYDALGIYKVENKDSFIEISSDKLIFKKGIGARKLDKACLILFSSIPYSIFIIDNISAETEYWKNEFINADYKNDSANNTNQFLSLTKNFVTKRLPQEFDISKADQADILNKSVQFLKENGSLDFDNFATEVIGDPKAIESFKKFKSDFEEDRNFEFSHNFDISGSVVKKQARSLKSVIKLDKNFHIYVHGNRDLIEQGEDVKGKFYKVYYQQEE